MYGLRIIKTIVVCLCLWSASAMAQDSVTLTYQGSLSDAGGQAINGTRAMTFRLYSQSQGGQMLWSENHGEADVIDGFFSVVLGQQSAFGADVLGAAGLYLGVQIGEDVEMSPRMRVGGALKAQWAAVAAHARDVRGEDINPASVTVGGQQVINAAGEWAGPNENLLGPRGPQGERGSIGERGPQGDEGERGARGDVGPRGDPGPPGERGPAGQAGERGAAGPGGALGSQGPAGPPGRSISFFNDADGDGYYDWLEIAVGSDSAAENDVPEDANFDGIPDGLVGPAGPRGAQGIQGAQGPAGPPGARGIAGEVGEPGPRGDRGDRGERGPQGEVGPEGPIGPAGNDGVQGPAGPAGDAGPQGTPGPLGPVGPPGADGLRGPDGPEGGPGPQGVPGPEGAVGPPGAQGPAGPGIEIGLDSDEDGFQDWIEVLTGSDPGNGESQPTDANGDGVADQLVGPIGPAGAEGPAGADGANGADGENGGLADFDHINPTVMTSRLVRAFSAPADEMPLVDPQDGNPVESIINVPVSGPLVSVRVTVDIEHGDLTELTMRLRSPRGTIITLHEGAEGQDLALTYPDDAEDTAEAMAQFVGEGSRGNWTLILTDVEIGTRATINSWDIEVTYTSSDQLDFVGNIDMHDNTIYNLGDPTTDTHAVNKAYVDAIEDRVNELVTQRLQGIRRPTYRWAVWSTYDQNAGWYDGNSGRLFGGVNPHDWSDSDRTAGSMSSDKGVLAALFTRKGWASRNGDANIYGESWKYYSSTNGRHAGALFRIRNTTDQPITWTARYNTTSYSGWNERSSIAVNGNNLRNGSSDYANQRQATDIAIPANRISTVIFISGSSQPSGDLRSCFLAFNNGSLNLPEGLEFVDDLDTAENGWDN